MDTKKDEWEQSYSNRGNYLFYPNDFVIRFLSKNIRKRIGVNEFKEISKGYKTALDLGCGIGRHVKLLDEFGFDSYGIDLSEKAISFAKEWFSSIGKHEICENLYLGSVTEMPYEDDFFDVVVSNSVLDSMAFDLAMLTIEETARIMKSKAFLYVDLIGSESNHDNHSSAVDVVVSIDHEKGTIQSYYDMPKIHMLLDKYFDVLDIATVTNTSVIENNFIDQRYHITARRK